MHKTDTHVRFGNGRGSVLDTSTGFASNVMKKFPSPYAILKNIIIRSKYDASARHPIVHASPYMESTVTVLNLSERYKKNAVFIFPFANPLCGLFCNFFLLLNLSKHYSL